MKSSVAIATYNGEKYIKEQLMSILLQLGEQDEIIVSDDGSTDKTIDIINSLKQAYPQIKLVSGPRKGIVRNFMNAITYCNNEVIFLSDQDDIWCEDKVIKVQKCFENNKNIKVVLHNAKLLCDGEVLQGRLLKYRNGFFINLLKSSYWGCCMAMRKDFTVQYFDANSDGIAHDQIIGLLGEKDSSTCYLDEDLIQHRIHGKNKTQKLSFLGKIYFRIGVYRDFRRYYYDKKGRKK